MCLQLCSFELATALSERLSPCTTTDTTTCCCLCSNQSSPRYFAGICQGCSTVLHTTDAEFQPDKSTCRARSK